MICSHIIAQNQLFERHSYSECNVYVLFLMVIVPIEQTLCVPRHPFLHVNYRYTNGATYKDDTMWAWIGNTVTAIQVLRTVPQISMKLARLS